MLADSISWSQFAVVAAVGVGVYYVYIIAMGKLKLIPKNQTGPPKVKSGKETKRVWNVSEVSQDEDILPPDEEEQLQDSVEENDAVFQRLEMLANDIQETIANSPEDITKEELLATLHEKIVVFPDLNQPAFRAAIANIIIRAAKLDVLIDISKAEAEALFGQAR